VGVKQLERESGCSPPASAEVQKVGSSISTSTKCFHGMVLRHSDNFYSLVTLP